MSQPIPYTPKRGAYDVPPRVEHTITLPTALLARFVALTSYDANHPNVLALRRDIADEMNIPWIAIHIESGRVVRRDIQRGDPITLPREWRAQMDALNQQGLGRFDAAWMQLRAEVAGFTGLRLAHVQLERGIDGGWEFQRSLVPNIGEIADGQALVIPEASRGRLEGVHTKEDLDRVRDSLLEDIFVAYRLPFGRIFLEWNRGVVQCVYREPAPGVPLKLPHGMAGEIQRLYRLRGDEGQAGLKALQPFVALHYGLEPNQITMLIPKEGEVEFRLAPPPPPNGPNQSHQPPPPPGPPGLANSPIVPIGPKLPRLPLPTDDSVSTGGVVGIVFGSLSGLILIVLVVLFIRKRRTKPKKSLTHYGPGVIV